MQYYDLTNEVSQVELLIKLMKDAIFYNDITVSKTGGYDDQDNG